MGRLPQPPGMQTGYCVMCNIQPNAVPSLGCHLGSNKRWGRVEGELERKIIINRRSRTDKYKFKWRRSRKPELTQGVSWRNNKSRRNPACQQKRMSQGMMPCGPGQPEGGPPHSTSVSASALGPSAVTGSHVPVRLLSPSQGTCILTPLHLSQFDWVEAPWAFSKQMNVSVLSYGTHCPFSLAFTVLQCVQFTSIRMPSSDPQWIFIFL